MSLPHSLTRSANYMPAHCITDCWKSVVQQRRSHCGSKIGRSAILSPCENRVHDGWWFGNGILRKPHFLGGNQTHLKCKRANHVPIKKNNICQIWTVSTVSASVIELPMQDSGFDLVTSGRGREYSKQRWAHRKTSTLEPYIFSKGGVVMLAASWKIPWGI